MGFHRYFARDLSIEDFIRLQRSLMIYLFYLILFDLKIVRCFL